MEGLKKGGRKLVTLVVAILLAVGVFAFSSFLSTQAHSSTFLAQSRIFRVLLEEDSVDFLSLLTDKDKRKTTEKFIVALTNAYVNFELIPINEGETFTVVMSSVKDGVVIDSFVYHGRDLVMEGTGPNWAEIAAFIERLNDKEYFQKVELIQVDFKKEPTAFSLRCVAKEMRYPDLFAPTG